MTERSKQSWTVRLALPLAIALAAAALVRIRGTGQPAVSDFDQLWVGARALLHGVDPYTTVGPGRELNWDYLYYPVPAMVLVMPLAMLPLLVARMTFAAISAGVLAAGLTRDNPTRLLLFLSAPTLVAIGRGQFGPLILASAFFPWLAWIGAAKPNIAIAVVPVSRNIRTTITAGVIGSAIILAISFALQPHWLSAWRESLSHKGDNMPVVMRLGGPLILLALIRWRRRESWLVAALGSVPQTPSPYDTLPLFAVPNGFREMALLVTLGNLALLFLIAGVGVQPNEVYQTYNRQVSLWSLVFLYLPCVLFILMRPNETRPPKARAPGNPWVDRILLATLLFSVFFAGWATLAKYL